MKIYSSDEAWSNLAGGWEREDSSIPPKSDSEQYDGVGFLPKYESKFKFNKEDKVFTIGSCFAREIEHELGARGFNVPALNFAPNVWSFAPTEELNQSVPASHLLNEYSVGTMYQRVFAAITGEQFNPEAGIAERELHYADMFLIRSQLPVTMDQLMLRRKIIDKFYKELVTSNVVIITLGLTECWYDTKYNVYFNATPPKTLTDLDTDRFKFHHMSFNEVKNSLTEVVRLLNTCEVGKKIVLTVSPVPLEATFSNKNCIMATSYAKGTLRAVAEEIANEFDNVDYFPSYEIVTSRGCAGYAGDNVHILRETVLKVMDVMTKTYI